MTWPLRSQTVVVHGSVVTCASEVFFEQEHMLIGLYRGFFGPGEMQKEFEEAAFALQPGEVSRVVDTASGVHLIERYR